MTATRRLAAILAVDIVGYSRLMGEDEAGTALIVREHRDAARPIIEEHGGRVVKTMGDGLLLEFPSVVAAVECAVLIQKLMVERNAAAPPQKQIVYRIGVNLGDVLIDGDDILGDGVNIAARLESVCEPGGVLVSSSAYDQVRGKIDAHFVDAGEQRLKNIAAPVRAYALQTGGLPAPRTVDSPPAGPMSAASRRSERETRRAQKAADPLRPLRRTLLLAFLLAAVGWRYVQTHPIAGFTAPRVAPVAAPTPPPAANSRISLVVLPFANLSGDPAQNYLADALTDALTTGLARLPDSFVIARNTAFTFKNQPIDARAIGKDLGVRYVLEGSVQPSGAAVRVNAQLIDAGSGAHLWAEQFDTPRANILQMQDEIVAHLAHALEWQLPAAEAARRKGAGAANPDAEDLALQCFAAVEKSGYFGKEADAAFSPCDAALAIDPNNVGALTLLALKTWLTVANGHSADPRADLKRAGELVSKALALDPNSVRAHLVNAVILREKWSFPEAIAEAEHALYLDPAVVEAYSVIGVSNTNLGEFEKGLEYADKAIRLSPHDPALYLWYADKALALFGLKQYDSAIEFARRAIAINPQKQQPHRLLISALGWTGQEAEAHQAIQRYLALFPEAPTTIAALSAAVRKEAPADADPRYLELGSRVIEGLSKAGLPEK
jgi:TolB-like protein/class 3 adenylate cyclase/tetratricopeptide (TPR) repeat protein